MAYQNFNRFLTKRDTIDSRNRAARRGEFSMIDSGVDDRWAQFQRDTSGQKNYYDYFFGPQDVTVYVAELGNDQEFGSLPIYNLGFNVSQEKAPIYGFWDYTFSSVMRGTRVVSGTLSLITRYPDYMKKLLMKAASERSANNRNLQDDYPRPSTWVADEDNIDRYWNQHIDPSAIAQGMTEWSIHPPFGLVVVYGVQETSVTENTVGDRYDSRTYRRDNALLFDRNERLLEADNNESTRIILDHCELTSVDRVFSPEQQVLIESYEFFARDIFVPR